MKIEIDIPEPFIDADNSMINIKGDGFYIPPLMRNVVVLPQINLRKTRKSIRSWLMR